MDSEYSQDRQLDRLNATKGMTRDADLGIGVPFHAHDTMAHEAIDVP
jgi:hypothetical protein